MTTIEVQCGPDGLPFVGVSVEGNEKQNKLGLTKLTLSIDDIEFILNDVAIETMLEIAGKISGLALLRQKGLEKPVGEKALPVD